MNYLVKWEIDIDADSPHEAAEKALAIQRNPESIATVFEVTFNTFDQDGYGVHTHKIDLGDDE